MMPQGSPIAAAKELSAHPNLLSRKIGHGVSEL